MTDSHFIQESENIKKKLLDLSKIIIDLLNQSVIAINKADSVLAKDILKKDKNILKQQITVEEDCLKILALYHPFAKDMRSIMTLIKINTYLECTSRLISRLVKIIPHLEETKINCPFNLIELGKSVTALLKDDILFSLTVSSKYDDKYLIQKSKSTKKERKQITKKHLNNLEVIANKIIETQNNTYQHFISISKHFEQITMFSESIINTIVYQRTGKLIPPVL